MLTDATLIRDNGTQLRRVVTDLPATKVEETNADLGPHFCAIRSTNLSSVIFLVRVSTGPAVSLEPEEHKGFARGKKTEMQGNK